MKILLFHKAVYVDPLIFEPLNQDKNLKKMRMER